MVGKSGGGAGIRIGGGRTEGTWKEEDGWDRTEGVGWKGERRGGEKREER